MFTSLRISQYTFLHLLPSIYDFMSEFIKKSHSALSLYMYIPFVHIMLRFYTMQKDFL